MTPRDYGRVALAALVVIGVCVALYLGFWWLRGDSTDRQVGIQNRNTGTQTAWRDEAVDLINEADLLPVDAPQRGALERQACELIDRLTDTYMTDRLVAFEEAECL